MRSVHWFVSRLVLVLVAVVLLVTACRVSAAPRKAPIESASQTSVGSTAAEQLVQSFALNDYKRVLDGQWQGIRYASDGNVYFGSSTHSAHHGAAFFKYNPLTNEVTLLVEDITTICGEDPQTNPQGKLHSDIVESNGWLYMSTHFSSEMSGAYTNWSGSHVLGYELATGTFRDYGIVHPNYTSYSGIGVDPVRNYLYVFVTGQKTGQISYIYRIDTVTGVKTNLGQVGTKFNASYWMFVDGRGDVWFSVKNQNGDLRRIRANNGQIDVFPNALPPLYKWDVEQVNPGATEQSNRYIYWMQPLDGDRALFTLGTYGGMLYLFDASKPIGSGQEFQNMKHIGYTDLGLALGNNRVFYYQRANRGFGHQNARDFHLLSVSLDSVSGYPITDHGLLKDQDGRDLWRAPGMMTDGHNRVFLIGDWWIIPGDLGTLRYNYNGGNEIYEQLSRGEFFAVANIDNDPPGSIDLSITNTDSPDPVSANGLLTYTIQVTNNASTEATGVIVTDTLPANVNFISATSGAGSCTKSADTITCQISNLSSGASATITITVRPPSAGTLTNTASVIGNEPDPNTANNTFTQNTTVFVETVQFSAVSYSGSENAGTATITVTRSGTGLIAVDYSTSNNTAVAGSDYTAASGRLNFAAGEGSKTFTVSFTNDSFAEGNESLNLTLSSPAGAALGPNRRAVLTILDEEELDALQFSSVSYTVPESAGSSSITVSRRGDSSNAVTVDWSVASNTATLGTDFSAPGGTLTFGPGVISQSFLMQLTNDTFAEGNESVHLRLANPNGGTILNQQNSAILTIIDNDVPTTGFKFSSSFYKHAENASMVVSITRPSGTTAQSVTFATSNNGTAISGTDFTAVNTIINFAIGETSKTVDIPILTDAVAEGNESFNLTLNNPTGGGTLAAQRTAVLIIADDDTNGSLKFKSTAFVVSESTANATITVTRGNGSWGAISVNYSTANNTAIAGSDYTVKSGVLNFAQGETVKTFTIPILNDTSAEGAESLNLTLSNPTGGATLATTRRAILTITDND